MFVESLDRAFENVCELDLVFYFDDVSSGSRTSFLYPHCIRQVHHILAEVIQGGLVLETNVEEIGEAGEHLVPRMLHTQLPKFRILSFL